MSLFQVQVMYGNLEDDYANEEEEESFLQFMEEGNFFETDEQKIPHSDELPKVVLENKLTLGKKRAHENTSTPG